jgi:hypothetical protein
MRAINRHKKKWHNLVQALPVFNDGMAPDSGGASSPAIYYEDPVLKPRVNTPVIRIGQEINWLAQGKAPLYLSGRIADFPQFKKGDTVTYENFAKTLTAKIDDIWEDEGGFSRTAPGWGTVLILTSPSIPFESLNTEGGFVSPFVAQTKGGSDTVIKKSNMKYLFIGVLFIGAAALAWKYRNKFLKK